jgi:hypothetical protein
VYEVQKRVDGKMRRVKLRAKIKMDAINEARGLAVDLTAAASRSATAQSPLPLWQTVSSSARRASSVPSLTAPSSCTGNG